MNVLYVGDVVGKPGRRILQASLPRIQDQYDPQLVIVNAENIAGGFGLTENLVEQFLTWGVDVLTTGNHVWDQREALEFIQREARLLRPGNYPADTPGRGHYIATAGNGHRVMVINILGNVFMHPQLDCPFESVERILHSTSDQYDSAVVDFHAEASSEKTAMGCYLDGRVAAVVGSHTHVPTNDARVLPGGTAYISDAGMTGCYDSIIGMDKQASLQRFTRKIPERLKVADGDATLFAVVIDIDEASGGAKHIQAIRFAENSQQWT